MWKDYYAILEIDVNASTEEIKKAFKRQAKLYHPDMHEYENPTDQQRQFYEAKTKDLNEAYDVLKNVQRRAEYDRDYELNKIKQKRFTEDSYETNYADFYDFYDFSTNRSNSRSQRSEYRRSSNGTTRRTKTGKINESFYETFVRNYKEIRKDENKYPFYKRHEDINDNYYENHYHDVSSKFDRFIFHFNQGCVHAFYEALYQLSKLTTIRKDTVLKYAIRNRWTITLTSVILATIMVASGNTKNDIKVTSDDQLSSVVLEQIPEEDIVINHAYTIQKGDTLTSIAKKYNSSIEQICALNDLEEDEIYYGENIMIPISVNKNRIDEYTIRVPVGEQSLIDLAQTYDTDVETLINLNQENITSVGDFYEIVSKTAVIPNITINDQNIENKSYIYR